MHRTLQTTSKTTFQNTSTTAASLQKTEPPSSPLYQKGDRRYGYLMMIAHLCDDLNQGALVAVIPFLMLHGNYSYAEVTALLLASNTASAIIQPLFGWLGDKKPRPWLHVVRNIPCRPRYGRNRHITQLPAYNALSNVERYRSRHVSSRRRTSREPHRW